MLAFSREYKEAFTAYQWRGCFSCGIFVVLALVAIGTA